MKKQKGKKKAVLAVLLSTAVICQTFPVYSLAAQGPDGICPHHTEHTAECGYREAAAEVPCNHQHTEECYKTETNCLHQHAEECYPLVPSETDETQQVRGSEPAACTHVCSEESGCITKTETCTHVQVNEDGTTTLLHDEKCGYVAAQEAAACQFVCEECQNIAAESERLAAEAEKAAQEAQQKIDNVQSLISTLPKVEDVQILLENPQEQELEVYRTQIKDAKAAYDELPPEQQAQVKPELTEKLQKLLDCFAAQSVMQSAAPKVSVNDTFSVDNINYKITALSDGEVQGEVEIIESPNASGNLVLGTVEYEGEKYLITSVGGYAFYYCGSLSGVEMPSATSIGDFAFAYTGLSSVKMPSATSIGDFAFAYTGLSSVEMPSATSIGKGAFQYIGLSSVEMPKVTSIGAYAFLKCGSLSSVKMPSTTSIGDNAFAYTGLSSVEMPKVTSIGAYAFSECGSLSSVEMPSATSVGDNAFAYTGLSSVEMPKVTSIGKGAFAYTGLSSIEMPSATSIGDYAFEYTDLSSVEMPKVTSIGAYAFSNCGSLSSVEMPSATSIGDNAFEYTGLSSVEMPSATSIGERAFQYTGLSSVEMPSATSIGERAFQYTGLSNVEMPSVTSIGEYAFAYTGLTTLILPASLTKIEKFAFSDCYSLTTLFCSGMNTPELGRDVFWGAQIEKFFVPVGAAGYTTANGWPVEPTDWVGQVEINGTVKDETENPVPNASVRIEINGLYYYGTTKENGSYTISILESVNEVKSYTIIASKEGYVSNEPVSEEITGETITKDLTIKRDCAASVTINDETQNYMDLDAAIQAAGTQEATITLLKDTAVGNQPIQGNITLVGGEHTLTNFGALTITGTLTIKSGNYVGDLSLSSGTLNIDGGTFQKITANTGSTIHVTAGTFDSLTNAVLMPLKFELSPKSKLPSKRYLQDSDKGKTIYSFIYTMEQGTIVVDGKEQTIPVKWESSNPEVAIVTDSPYGSKSIVALSAGKTKLTGIAGGKRISHEIELIDSSYIISIPAEIKLGQKYAVELSSDYDEMFTPPAINSTTIKVTVSEGVPEGKITLTNALDNTIQIQSSLLDMDSGATLKNGDSVAEYTSEGDQINKKALCFDLPTDEIIPAGDYSGTVTFRTEMIYN